jgi:NADPH:quinone reductase-like Zn-dependent oxidoreductase
LDLRRALGYASRMRALWTTRIGRPETLEVRETPDPEPGPKQVRVRVRAAGLNFADVMARQGLYPDAPKLPAIMGYECAGVIDAIGGEVRDFALGLRVMAFTRFGGQSDCVCVDSEYVFRIPDALSFEHAAALPVSYLTAYHMLFNVARVRPGDHVLVHMAAGGAGTAALQLCRSIGSVVTYGTASSSKHDFVRAHGCQHPIDYHTHDYVAEVRRLSEGRGVNYVLDALGGGDWKKGYSLLRPGGLLIAFGFANMNKGKRRQLAHVVSQALRVPLYTPMKLLNENRGIAGVNMGHLWGESVLLGEAARQIIALYSRGQIAPHVHSTFHFAQAADAHRLLEGGQSFGKIILVP